jgi:hypothetical protein
VCVLEILPYLLLISPEAARWSNDMPSQNRRWRRHLIPHQALAHAWLHVQQMANFLGRSRRSFVMLGELARFGAATLYGADNECICFSYYDLDLDNRLLEETTVLVESYQVHLSLP